LSGLGRRRNPDYLVESLLRPDADVAAGYRAVRVTTSAGETVNGIRLNEDDISIQLRDDKGNLRSFLKDKLIKLRYDEPSLMPAFGSVLSKREIDDVVSYLSSLRGPQ
jgi:putative heme-binding domain-containing protein